MANDIKPKTISFKDGRDVDRIDELFKPGTRLYNRAPDAIKGNRSKMALWSIEALTQLYDGGVDNLQAELFSPESEQSKVTTEEIGRLKERITQLEQLESGYVKDINELIRQRKEAVTTSKDQERLLEFYRTMARNLGVTVDEERGSYREKYDDVWIHPAL